MCGFWIILVMFSTLVILDKFVSKFVEKFLSLSAGLSAGICCFDCVIFSLLSSVCLCGCNDVVV